MEKRGTEGMLFFLCLLFLECHLGLLFSGLVFFELLLLLFLRGPPKVFHFLLELLKTDEGLFFLLLLHLT